MESDSSDSKMLSRLVSLVSVNSVPVVPGKKIDIYDLLATDNPVSIHSLSR